MLRTCLFLSALVMPAVAFGQAPMTRQSAPVTAGPPSAPPVAAPENRRKEARKACREDVRSLCGGVEKGGGRVMACLAANGASLSAPCKEALSAMSTAR